MKMDSLLFPNKPLPVTLVSKDRLFYDRYDYVICVKIPEISALRHKSHSGIDQELNHRHAWRCHVGSRNFGGSWRNYQRDITGEIRQNCHDFFSVLESMKDWKAWYSQDWAYVYSSDLSLLREIEKLDYATPVHLRKVSVDRERDTLLIKNSPYSARSYLRPQKLTETEAESMRNLLLSQQEIRLSPSLAQWVKEKKWCYVRENYFIDHNNNGIELMLSLVSQRPIRKTMAIKHHK